MSKRTCIASIAGFTVVLAVAAQASDDEAASSYGQQASSQQQGAAPSGGAPDRPTFYKDVLPIFQENCQVCHRPQGLNMGGMIAPMALRTYEEVRPHARTIATYVEERTMPPWHAAPEHHGVFANERSLTQDEIDTIVRWVRSGAPRGNPEDAPPPATFPSDTSGWVIGEPDLIVRFTEPYLVKDEVEDEYVDIRVPITEEMMPEDRWIKAVEFRPGSPVVHHIIANPLGGIAPGYAPRIYADGYSRVLRKRSTVNFQMHYHKKAGPGTAVWDQTEVAIKFYEPGEVIEHIVETEPLGMFRFVIPAGDPDYSFHTDYTLEKDVNLLWMNPHMHLRGKAAKYVVTFPDGRQEVLLHVPQYDFNWQHTYLYKEPVFLPRGTKIDFTLWWNNSADNPANPDPNRQVRWGRPTTDEMGFGWMSFVEVEPRHIIVGDPIPDDLPRPRRAGPRPERQQR